MPQSLSNIIDAGDVLVVGAGLAGLFTALKLAPRQVFVLAAGKRTKGAASKWAQGGIAAALAADDCAANHARDTINAGAGLVDPAIADILANEAAARITDLSNFGVTFDTHEDGRFRLGREAAHSHHRIVGVQGDRTGREIMTSLMTQAEATPSLHFLEGFAAYELAIENGRVVGVFARPEGGTNLTAPLFIRARATILATGGSGHLYTVTTNPRRANGEALAMAARAGAQIADAEFMQFHPTALTGQGIHQLGTGVNVNAPVPLATEALRGEGAILVNAHGDRFMLNEHRDGELAPRDIVARAVMREIEATGAVGLDLRPSGLAEVLSERFPTVAASCKKAAIDPTRMALPVAPAAHFHMGGIRTDAHGRTNLAGLWACGEVASTGAHGANRLASNSLLEALVFGARIAHDVNHCVTPGVAQSPQPPQIRFTHHAQPVAHVHNSVRTLMGHHVGVTRNHDGLLTTLHALKRLQRATGELAPQANIILAARLIATAALQRKESRGGHFRQDFPNRLETPEHSTLTLTDVEQFHQSLPDTDNRATNALAESRP